MCVLCVIVFGSIQFSWLSKHLDIFEWSFRNITKHCLSNVCFEGVITMAEYGRVFLKLWTNDKLNCRNLTQYNYSHEFKNAFRPNVSQSNIEYLKSQVEREKWKERLWLDGMGLADDQLIRMRISCEPEMCEHNLKWMKKKRNNFHGCLWLEQNEFEIWNSKHRHFEWTKTMMESINIGRRMISIKDDLCQFMFVKNEIILGDNWM